MPSSTLPTLTKRIGQHRQMEHRITNGWCSKAWALPDSWHTRRVHAAGGEENQASKTAARHFQSSIRIEEFRH